MAKMKAEFLNGWHKENGIPFISRFFGEPERYYPLASAIAPVSNLINRWSGFRYLLQETIGIDARRRSEEHTSELQSRGHLVCRLLLGKKKNSIPSSGSAEHWLLLR